MLIDIFSGFDDHNQVFIDFSFLVWGVVVLSVLSFFVDFWGCFNFVGAVSTFFMVIVDDLVVRTQGKNIGGSVSVFRVLFIFLVSLNLLGLVPYVFSLTSHLAVNLSLSLPLWVIIVFMSITYDIGSFLAHLQPIGSPAALNPFLCVIELVSLLVRPITLAVRLTANLSTGHILMALLGVGFVNSGVVRGLVILFLGIFYFIFEIGVCFIQAYIFTLLPTLYLDEHPRDSH